MSRFSILILLIFPVCAFSQVELLPRGITPNGTVFDVEQMGNTLYVSGGFSRVGYDTGGGALFPKSGIIPDLTFPRIDGDVYSIVSDGNGGWYVCGDFDEVDVAQNVNLAHILPNMEVDPAFSFNINGIVYDLALMNDTLFFGGSFTSINSNSIRYLSAIDLQTNTLLAFNGLPNGQVRCLDNVEGNLLVGGNFTRIGGQDQPGLAMLSASTGKNKPFPAVASGAVYTVHRKGDTLIAGGTFSAEVGAYTGRAAYFPNGQDEPDRLFPAANGNVESIISDGNGGWFIAGSFTQIGDNARQRLAHILPDLSIDPGMNFSINGTVFALSLVNDTLFFGGNFTTIDGQSRGRIAAAGATTGTLFSWNPESDGTVNAILPVGNKVFLGGIFSRIGGDAQPRLACIDRTTGMSLPIPSPGNGQVNTITELNGKIFAGGSFSGSSGHYTGYLANYAGLSDLPQLDGIDFGGAVEAIIPDGSGGWYVGGSFFQVSGQTLQRLAHILPNGSLDPAFTFQPNGTVNALSLFNDTMLIAGNFTQINGTAVGRLAAIDISSGTLLPWNPDLGGTANALLVENGALYVGGTFTTAGGQTRNRLASWDLASLTLNSWHPDLNGAVNDLLTYSGEIVALGAFSQCGGQPRSRFAMIDPVSSFPSATAFTINTTVNTGFLIGDILYLGGGFTLVEGQSRLRLAAVDLSAGTLTSWDPGSGGTVNDLLAWNDTMLIGGGFTTLGLQPRERMGAVSVSTGTLLNWNPGLDNAVNVFARSGNQLLVGGNFKAVQAQSRNRVLVLEPTMSISSLDPSPNNQVNVMIPDGQSILIGGNFTQIGGQMRQRLASFDGTSGSVDAWNPGADATVNHLGVFNDTILVAGDFDMLSGQPVARFGAVSKSTGAIQSWFSPDPNDDVLTFARSGTGMISGGRFVSHRSAPRQRLFAMNLASNGLLDFAPNVSGFGPRVNSISSFNDTMLVVGGLFTTVDGAARKNLFSISLSGALQSFAPEPNDEVFAVMMSGDSLFAGGEFTEISGLGLEFGAALDPVTGIPGTWTPKSDWAIRRFHQSGDDLFALGEFFMMQSEEREDAFAMNMETGELLPWNPVASFLLVVGMEVDPTREIVYLYGFDSGNSQHVKAFDADSGQQISNWNFTFDGQVRSIDHDPKTGDLYIGGEFDNVNGIPRKSVAGIGTSGNILPFQASMDGAVRGIAVWDSLVYMAGDFETIEGEPRTKVASMSMDGTLKDWNPELNIPFFSSMGTIIPQSDRVYLSGNFSAVNGDLRDNIAAVDPITGKTLPWNPRLNGQDRSLIKPLGNRVFIGGDFTDAGGTQVLKFGIFGSLSAIMLDPIPDIGLSSVFAMGFNDTMLFLAGDFRQLGTKYYPFLSRFSFSSEALTGRLESYSPKVGGNTGDVTISVNGSGFIPGTRLYLRSPNFPELVPYDSATVIYQNGRIESTFDLRGVPAGIRDLVLEIPGDTTIVLVDGFEIVPGTKAEPWADFLVPAIATARRKEFFYVSYGNSGNIDAHGVPIWIAFSPDIEVQDIAYNKIEVLDPNDPMGDSIEEFFPIDSLNGKPFPANVYAYVIPKIAAGSSKTVRVRAVGKKSGTLYVVAWTSDPMYGSPMQYYVGECMDALMMNIVGFVPVLGCAAGILDGILSPGFDLAYDPDFGSSSWWLNYTQSLGGTALGCFLDLTTGGAGRVTLEILDLMLKYKSAGELGEKCFTSEEKEPDPIEYVESHDPNDKTGFNGQGGLGWLTTKRRFPYMIRFENDPTATAPAKEVIIRDTLDQTVFDLSTLEVKGFSIGDTSFIFPAGKKGYNTTVDLRPNMPVYVNVDARLNPGGELAWRFVALDTATLQPLQGPLEGFLPPNIDTLSGQGAVLYDILPYDTLSSGRTIWNEAEIYFDFNPPIITDPWILTADNHRPESQIDPLPDTIYQSPVTVSWSGTDIGSGIRHVDILMRINGDRWQYAAVAEGSGSIDVNVLGGNTYEFYSVAFDTALNQEIAYPIADETIFVAQGVDIEEELTAPEVVISPNPNHGSFSIQINDHQPGVMKVELTDLMGRNLKQEEYQLETGPQKLLISTDLPNGIYLLTYRINGYSATEKVKIIR